MSVTVEHKTFKQALLEFYQARGIPSSEIKFEVKVEGSPHCPNFRCTVKLPRVPTTHFNGHDLTSEGKSKKAAEHAAAAAALDHLRDVGLLKVPAPAARATPPPPPPYPMGGAGFGPQVHGYAGGGGRPWAPQGSGPMGRQPVPPEPHPSAALRPEMRSYAMQSARQEVRDGAEDTQGISSTPSRASSSTSGLRDPASGAAKIEAVDPAANTSLVTPGAPTPSWKDKDLTEKELIKGATEPFCINPEKLPAGEASRQLELANAKIQWLYALLLEERQRKKFAAEVLLGMKDGNQKFLEADATQALETKFGHLKLLKG